MKLIQKNVYYVKDIGKNILSFSRITKNNCTIVAKNNSAKIFYQNNKLLAVAYQDDNLYKMKSYVKRNLSKIYTIATKLTEKEEWHRALGHVNFQYLNILIKNKLLKIEKLNFLRSNYNSCLYVNNTNKDPIYILVFVDDLSICCKNKNMIDEIKDSIMKKFSMKNLGKVGNYIGIDIEYSKDRSKTTLNQTKYIESLAVKYNYENGTIDIVKIDTSLNLADMLTKSLDKTKFVKNRNALKLIL